MCMSLAMLVGCYVFGSIPLSLTISQKNMRSVSIVGAGLIVGTALSVIIPEGVHSIYDQGHSGHDHSHGHSHDHGHSHEKSHEDEHEHEGHKHSRSLDATDTTNKLGFARLHEHLKPDVELHSMIGISLSLGFVFMLLVDNLCGHGHSHGGPE